MLRLDGTPQVDEAVYRILRCFELMTIVEVGVCLRILVLLKSITDHLSCKHVKLADTQDMVQYLLENLLEDLKPKGSKGAPF